MPQKYRKAFMLMRKRALINMKKLNKYEKITRKENSIRVIFLWKFDLKMLFNKRLAPSFNMASVGIGQP